MNKSPSEKSPQKEYLRFAVSERIEHLLLFVSFTILVITGIPQKYAPAPWAETMIGLLGGIETVRIIHRIAAIVLILESIYHIASLGYKMYVRRTPLYMLPGTKDVVDFLDAVRYNLGLARKHPRYDRYNFEEKIEYWAVIWGTAIMIITGFILWNPISAAKLMPGSIIPAAKAAHGGEALLAFLAILIWHVYGVHIKTFNRSIFTGKLTREQMEQEHALELERIESGNVPPPPPRQVIRRRERIYLPIAGLFVAVLLFVLYVFVTYEETAIATVPPAPEEIEVFVRATPTPAPTPESERWLDVAQEKTAPLVPHEIVAGRENCINCHGLGAIVPYTDIHAELKLGNESCLTCHELAGSGSQDLPTVESAQAPSFSTDVLSILQRKCVACHGLTDSLSLISYQSLLEGNGDGPLIHPGDAENSPLLSIQSLPPEEHPTRFSPQELEVVQAWIQAGAADN